LRQSWHGLKTEGRDQEGDKEEEAGVHYSLSDTFKMDRVLTVRAILHVFVEPGKIEDVGEVLAKMPEIIDVYEVTGEYDLIATAKANDLHRLRSLISERLMKMHGVKAVTASVVLHTYKLSGKEVFE